MSVPADFTVANLSGTFTTNKSLSDSLDDVLSIQGVGWMKRKAITAASATVKITHYTDDAGVEHVDTEQIAGGMTKSEDRVLTWTEKHKDDDLFGAVVAKFKRVKADELQEAYLKLGWTEETLERGLIHFHLESDTPKSKMTWALNQTWGIELIDGKRYYSRHLHAVGPKKEVAHARMVFDYAGN